MKISNLSARLDRAPMLKVVVPLSAGIVLADSFTLPWWLLATAFVVAGIIAVLANSSTAAVVFIASAGFGAAQFNYTEPSVPRNVPTAFEVAVESIPADRGTYFAAEGRITAWRDPSDGTWLAAHDRVMLRTDTLTGLDPGERIFCTGTIRPFNAGSENYQRLMVRRGFAGTLWLSERSVLERLPTESGSLHFAAVERMQRLPMNRDAGAVTCAMTAGDKSGITNELRRSYSYSGLSHLLAVSGLHTGIVFALVNLLLWWLPLFRRGHLVRNLVAAVAIWVFVAAAGFPPSAVRAAVMCTTLQFALASASEYAGLNALAAAAVVMLLYNPAWLGDISFQLSFAAVAGILVWAVPMCRRLHTRHRAVNILVDSIVVSLAATLAVAPLVSHAFGTIPLAGMAVNPVAIPIASIVVLVGATWMLVPIGWLAPVFAFVLDIAAGSVNWLARMTAAIPRGTVEYTLGGWPTALVYLVFIAATALMWCAEPKKTVHLSR